MRRESAGQIVRLLNNASQQITETIEIFRAELDPEEFKIYTTHIGRILGDIYLELVRPVAEPYPELHVRAETGNEISDELRDKMRAIARRLEGRLEAE